MSVSSSTQLLWLLSLVTAGHVALAEDASKTQTDLLSLADSPLPEGSFAPKELHSISRTATRLKLEVIHSSLFPFV